LTVVSVTVSTILFCFAHRHMYRTVEDWIVCLVSSVGLSCRFIANRNLMEIVLIHGIHNMHALVNEPGNNSMLVPIVFYSVLAISSTLVRR
jgi:membrane protease YdiL (CAAX protease family)